jgi:hypothetical protein
VILFTNLRNNKKINVGPVSYQNPMPETQNPDPKTIILRENQKKRPIVVKKLKGIFQKVIIETAFSDLNENNAQLKNEIQTMRNVFKGFDAMRDKESIALIKEMLTFAPTDPKTIYNSYITSAPEQVISVYLSIVKQIRKVYLYKSEKDSDHSHLKRDSFSSLVFNLNKSLEVYDNMFHELSDRFDSVTTSGTQLLEILERNIFEDAWNEVIKLLYPSQRKAYQGARARFINSTKEYFSEYENFLISLKDSVPSLFNSEFMNLINRFDRYFDDVLLEFNDVPMGLDRFLESLENNTFYV